MPSVGRPASRATWRMSCQRSRNEATGVLSVIQPSARSPTRRSARSATCGGVSSGFGFVAIQIGGHGFCTGLGSSVKSRNS